LKILIGVPVTERGVRRLSRSLPELARRYGSIALPLPQSLCMRVVTSPVEAMDYALKLMNPSNFRVWSSLLLALKDLVLSNPMSMSDVTLPRIHMLHRRLGATL